MRTRKALAARRVAGSRPVSDELVSRPCLGSSSEETYLFQNLVMPCSCDAGMLLTRKQVIVAVRE